MIKRIISLAVSLVCLVSLATSAFATSADIASDSNIDDPVAMAASLAEVERIIGQISMDTAEVDDLEEVKLTQDTKESINIVSPDALVSFDSIGDIAAAPEFDSAMSMSSSTNSRSSATAQTRSATLNINPNLIYTHGLAYEGDYYFYLTQMTSTVDATAFLMSSSMEYSIGVCIFDSSLNLISEQYSYVPSSWFGGQRLRVTASSGQYVALLVQGNGPFVAGNTYDFGIVTTARSSRDSFENNDTFQDVTTAVNMTSSLYTYSGANLDNIFDIDWYAFNYTGPSASGTSPSVQLWGNGASSVSALLFKVVNNQLQYYGYYPGQYDTFVGLDSSAATYYIAVFSENGSTGSYHLGVKNRVNNITIYTSIIESSGDQGMMNFVSYYGSRKTARYSLSGRIRVYDNYGNPVPGASPIVMFDSTIGTLAASTVTTNNDGIGYFSLSIPGTIVAPYSSTIGNYTHKYCYAELLVTYDMINVAAKEDWYYTSGYTYTGPGA